MRHLSIRLGCCNFGTWPSPYYLNGYAHLDARNLTSQIIIEDNVWISNNTLFVAKGSTITIGTGTLFGTEFMVFDPHVHDLHPDRRLAGIHVCEPVTIGKNVFIATRVIALKVYDRG